MSILLFICGFVLGFIIGAFTLAAGVLKVYPEIIDKHKGGNDEKGE